MSAQNPASLPSSIDASPEPAPVDPAPPNGPQIANLGDGANGRLSETEERFENYLRWHFNVVAEEGKGSAYIGLGIENAKLHLAAIVREHTERALAEVEQRITDIGLLLTALDEARERAATWDEVDRLSHENLLKERDEARAQVERLHFDLDREARARQAAEGALAAVREWADEWEAGPAVGYDRNEQVELDTEKQHARALRAALATPTTTEAAWAIRCDEPLCNDRKDVLIVLPEAEARKAARDEHHIAYLYRRDGNGWEFVPTDDDEAANPLPRWTGATIRGDRA